MGERQLSHNIVTVGDLIEAKLFDKVQDVYDIPDSVLPRVRRNGKIVRPLRFYMSDVDRIFSKPLEAGPEIPRPTFSMVERPVGKPARPTIQFKRRRR